MLAPLLFNIFFAAVINAASMRFKADKSIMDALVHLRKKRGAGGSNCQRVSVKKKGPVAFSLSTLRNMICAVLGCCGY